LEVTVARRFGGDFPLVSGIASGFGRWLTSAMATLEEVVTYLDGELGIARIPDYPGAWNGLQLENGGNVTRVAAAVDASLPVIGKAVAAGADLLVVHHGMFWQGLPPVRGAMFRKLKMAMDAGLAVYSAHLPLDVHPEWGNNILLARALGLESCQPFLDWKGLSVGLLGNMPMERESLAKRLGGIVAGPVHICPAGPPQVARIAVITGGAGSEVAAVASAGADTLITGEGPHWSFPLAEELGVNVLYAGHYATETFGVKALAHALNHRFGLPWSFLDHPTGL